MSDAHNALFIIAARLSDYAPAQNAYRQAVRFNPRDLQSRLQLELVADILSLDPMARRLATAERYRRSRRLLKRTVAAFDLCLAGRPDSSSDSLPPHEHARKLLSGTIHQSRSGDSIESNISLAEQLWTAKMDRCGPSAVPDKALALVLDKLAK